MNIKNLKEGMVIKNYKELSQLLGNEKPKTGKSKIIELEALKNFVDYDLDGNKFIINKIFNKEEISLMEIKKDKKVLYKKFIEVLVLDLLPKDKKSIVFSKNKLNYLLGLINNNYTLGLTNHQLIAENFNMDIAYVDEFYKLNESNMNNIVNTALNSLEKKSLIFQSKVMMVKLKNNNEHSEASDDLINTILEIESETRKIHNLKSDSNLNFIFNSPNYQKVKETRDRLLREKTNVEFYYRATKMILNYKHLESEKIELSNFILEEMERINEKEQLNNLYRKKVIANAKQRQINCKKENSIRNSNQYLSNYKCLSNNLLNQNALQIKSKFNFNLEIDTHSNSYEEIIYNLEPSPYNDSDIKEILPF